MTLYHYTCAHFAGSIAECGLVVPSPLTGMSWFTDLDVAIPEVLGLTSHMLPCDRTEFRFKLHQSHEDSSEVVPYRALRRFLEPELRERLETPTGALLMHWWVTQLPVGVDVA